MLGPSFLLLAAVVYAAEDSCPNQICPANLTEKIEEDWFCKCDDICHTYGDCCEDLTRRSNLTQSVYHGFMDCSRINDHQRTYVVKKCPRMHHLANLCAKQLSPRQKYHFSLDILVYSEREKIFFANMYCAQCHTQKSDLVFPSILKCDNTHNYTMNEFASKAVFNPSTNRWSLEGNLTCQLIFNISTTPRACFSTIRTCPAGKPQLKCGRYSQLVKGFEDDELYDSPDCALCNGVTNYTCQETRPFDGDLLTRINFSDGPSYTIIVSFNWSDWGSESFNPPETNRGLSYLSGVCLSISIICLLLHLLKHYYFTKQYNWNTLPRYQTNSLVISLLIFQTSFLFGVKPPWEVPKVVCGAIGAFIYFFGLSVFFWMNAISFDLWRTFSTFQIRQRQLSHFWKYAVYSWGIPALLTLFIVTMQFSTSSFLNPDLGNQASGLCWIANQKAFALYYFLPSCAIILVNTVFFVLTIKWLHNTMNNSRLVTHAAGRKEYKRFWLYLRFSLIMGLTWVIGFIASFAQSLILWYPFVLLNGLQGAFIFFMFDFKTSLSFFTCGLGKKTSTPSEEVSGQTVSSKVDGQSKEM